MDPALRDHADRVLEANTKKVCRDAFSNARLQATNAFLKTVKGQVMTKFRDVSDVYLTAEEYGQVSHIYYHCFHSIIV